MRIRIGFAGLSIFVFFVSGGKADDSGSFLLSLVAFFILLLFGELCPKSTAARD